MAFEANRSLARLHGGVEKLYLQDHLSGVSFLVNTGSAHTFVPATRNEQVEIDYDSRMALVNGLGERCPVYGDKLVKFDFGSGRQFAWRCLIGDQESVTPTIGLDFLSFYGLVVDIKNRRLETVNPTTNRLEERSWKFGDVIESDLPEPITSCNSANSSVFIEGKTSRRRRVPMMVHTGSYVSYIHRKEGNASLSCYGGAPARRLKWHRCRKVELRHPGGRDVHRWNCVVASPLTRNWVGVDYLAAHDLLVDCRNRRILHRSAKTDEGEAKVRHGIVSRIRKAMAKTSSLTCLPSSFYHPL